MPPLDVDKAKGLWGFCDFLITRSAEIYYLRGPVLAVVEAKKEDLVARLGQCAAELVALQLFNEGEGTPQPAVFGCVTSGSNWRFLKLQGKATVHRPPGVLPARLGEDPGNPGGHRTGVERARSLG